MNTNFFRTIYFNLFFLFLSTSFMFSQKELKFIQRKHKNEKCYSIDDGELYLLINNEEKACPLLGKNIYVIDLDLLEMIVSNENKLIEFIFITEDKYFQFKISKEYFIENNNLLISFAKLNRQKITTLCFYTKYGASPCRSFELKVKPKWCWYFKR